MSAGWSRFDRGVTIGAGGSETGTILVDEEHHLGGRITIERCGRGAPFAITCGLYGWMVHTRYFGSEDEARNACAAMKRALGDILETVPRDDDPGRDERAAEVVRAIERFVADFPT